jgi:hypothetical protein
MPRVHGALDALAAERFVGRFDGERVDASAGTNSAPGAAWGKTPVAKLDDDGDTIAPAALGVERVVVGCAQVAGTEVVVAAVADVVSASEAAKDGAPRTELGSASC